MHEEVVESNCGGRQEVRRLGLVRGVGGFCQRCYFQHREVDVEFTNAHLVTDASICSYLCVRDVLTYFQSKRVKYFSCAVVRTLVFVRQRLLDMREAVWHVRPNDDIADTVFFCEEVAFAVKLLKFLQQHCSDMPPFRDGVRLGVLPNRPFIGKSSVLDELVCRVNYAHWLPRPPWDRFDSDNCSEISAVSDRTDWENDTKWSVPHDTTFNQLVAAQILIAIVHDVHRRSGIASIALYMTSDSCTGCITASEKRRSDNLIKRFRKRGIAMGLKDVPFAEKVDKIAALRDELKTTTNHTADIVIDSGWDLQSLSLRFTPPWATGVFPDDLVLAVGGCFVRFDDTTILMWSRRGHVIECSKTERCD